MASKAMKDRSRVLVISGSTAVGKTELSLHLAQMLNGEIISADSAQVYQGMDIGTAKLCPDSTKVPHHLLDIVPVTHSYAAGEFRKDALKAIESILSLRRTPIIVGGTGFYLNTLLSSEPTAPASSAEDKQHVEQMVASKTWDQRYTLSSFQSDCLSSYLVMCMVSLELLRSCDPQYANSLSANDWFRLKRALEVHHQTGRPVSSFKSDSNSDTLPYEYKCLFLTMPRVLLYQRIDARCIQMIKDGLLQETITLVHKDGLTLNSPAGRSLGYRQALEFLHNTWGFPANTGHSSYQPKASGQELQTKFCDFLTEFQTKTRNFAQDQLTYFRRCDAFHWANVAPGNHRLPVQVLADHIMKWYLYDDPLPVEVNGNNLKRLTKEEQRELYKYKNNESITSSDIDITLSKIQHDLNNITC